VLGATLAEDEAFPTGGGAKGGGGEDALEPANAVGLTVSKTAASKDYFAFAKCFLPLAETTPEAEVARAAGFKMADPNGNGLCSLAELETFVLQTLTAAFPKNKTKKDHRGDILDRGKDIFTAFRPCYIRAFKDAADYKKDDGKVLNGTKTATNDDYVSVEEFRLFCAFCCAYSAMFDAFAKIDSGGSGRGAGDDRRIELAEWMARYRGVRGFGFVAFSNIKSKAAATEVFNTMDDNGGGIILLDEWSEFIKTSEVAAGTTLGQLLASDEGDTTFAEMQAAAQEKLKKMAQPKTKGTTKPFSLKEQREAQGKVAETKARTACVVERRRKLKEADAARAAAFEKSQAQAKKKLEDLSLSPAKLKALEDATAAEAEAAERESRLAAEFHAEEAAEKASSSLPVKHFLGAG